MPLKIRPATVDDASSLSRICLLTSDAGKSGESLHKYGELPGLLYAVPYVHLPSTLGYVLVDEADGEGEEKVVGYVLGSKNTREFESQAKISWWPTHRTNYPLNSAVYESGTDADRRYMRLLAAFPSSPEANIAFSPAHMHINILDAYQRKGWGKRLIGRMVEGLKAEGLDGVWLGMDPRNVDARKFYERIGFRRLEGGGEFDYGLRFEGWEG